MSFLSQLSRKTATPLRIHVGCGQQALPGWVNIDSQPLPGVDRILDVRRGLPYRSAAALYAEHFLEHLTLDEGLAFLRECRRVLSPEGVLRISTPNLDWVYTTHYRLGRWTNDRDAETDCLQINRAFRGWGHRFLYNRPLLAAALRAAGFDSIEFQTYGQSPHAELRGLERHETWTDTAESPHVLIVEASGRHEESEEFSSELLEDYREALSAH